jgi:hypothetical protein
MALEFATIAMADALCAPTRAVVETTRRVLPFTQDVDLFPSPVTNAECIHTPTHDVPPGSYVMFAGRVERLKGCCELALAANTFLRACPAAELRLYGPDRPLSSAPATLTSNNPWNGGSTREWMLAHLDADVLSRVRFMGTKPPSEMSTAYAAARFVVAPSRFENFGTTAAEALIAGRPVIYSAGTGLEETVADAGLPARPEDPEHLAAQMIRLWTDAPLRHSLAARGTDRLKHELSIETAIARRIAFYRKTIAQPSLNPSEKIRRLAALPPSSLHAVLQYASGITARLAAIPSSDTSSPGTRAARALEKLRHSGKPLSSLWLYGAGQHTRRLLVEREIIQHAGTRIRGIIDDSARPGDTLFDLPLLTRTAAESQHRDRQITIDALILSSDSLEETLWLNSECFRRQNIPVVRLYS